MNSSEALTLDDLDNVTPTYIGCVTINRWRRTPSPREAHYEVLTMTPHEIARLDRAPDDQEFHGKLMPTDVFLSDSAATSAAAIDHDSGGMQGDEEPFRDLKVMLGLSVGASVVADKRHEEKRHFCIQVTNKFIASIKGDVSGANGWCILKFQFQVRRSQSVLILSILSHPCSCLVYYYLFGVFLPK